MGSGLKASVLIILFICVGAAGGCGLTQRFGHRSAATTAPAPAAVSSAGRVDSLFSSGMPVDTLFLDEQPQVSSTALLPVETPLRMGPASAEIAGIDAVWGWRVQLASSSDRKALENMIGRVEREFGTSAYLVDLDKYYALRIGAFDNLESAGRERDRAVSYGYRNAWIVQTMIPPHQIQREE